MKYTKIQNLIKKNKELRNSDVFELCKNDILVFASYCKIKNTVDNYTNFALYAWQKKLLIDLQKHSNRKKEDVNDILFGPQCTGKTTVMCIYILWYLITKTEKSVWICASKDNIARKILKRIYDIYSLLPQELQLKLSCCTKHRLTVADSNTSVECDSFEVNTLRGIAPDLLFVDEMALCKNEEKTVAVLIPAYARSKTHIVFSSTRNAPNTAFYKFWKNAPKNGYVKCESC